MTQRQSQTHKQTQTQTQTCIQTHTHTHAPDGGVVKMREGLLTQCMRQFVVGGDDSWVLVLQLVLQLLRVRVGVGRFFCSSSLYV